MSAHELFTRCPTCKTVYRTNEEQLSVQAGKVRCGQCRMIFDGRAHLTDLSPRREHQPDERETGPPTLTLRSSVHLSAADEDAASPAVVHGGGAAALLAGMPRVAGEHSETSDVRAASSIFVPDATPPEVEPDTADFDAENSQAAGPHGAESGVRFFHRSNDADATSEMVHSDMSNADGSPGNPATSYAGDSGTEYAHDAHSEAGPIDAERSSDDASDVAAADPETFDAARADATAEAAAADGRSIIEEPPVETPESAASALDAPLDTAAAQASASTDADLVMPAWEEPPGPPRRGARWAYAVMALLLAITLAGQAIYHFRHSLAAEYPRLRPHLSAACVAIGCAIDPLHNKDDITIEAHDLQADPAHQGLLILQTTLRNQSRHSIAFPHMELELNDLGGRPIVRRIFAPVEYAGGAADFTNGMPANAEWNVKIFLDASSVSAGGYNLYLFYP